MAREWRKSFLLILIAHLSLGISIRTLRTETSEAKEFNQQYEEGDRIPLFANKVNPVGDPCEAYPYFDYPFCPPGDPVPEKKKSLEDLLAGDCFTNTKYELNFRVETVGKTLCEKDLTKDDVMKLKHAIANEYEYQMSYNNILFRGIVGKVESINGSGTKFYLVKHVDFHPYYMENRVKDIFLLSDLDAALDITEDSEIKVNFTYSVFWTEQEVDQTNTIFWSEASSEKVLSPVDGYRKLSSMLKLYFSASMIFSWVALLVATVMPYLRNYFTRYSHGYVTEDRGDLIQQQVHGNACKCPPYSSLLGAFLGIGSQQLTVVCYLFALAYKGGLNPCNQERLFTFLFLSYCLTSIMSGYIATSFHLRFSPLGWKECIFQTGALYFVPVFLTALLVNLTANMTLGYSDLPNLGTTVFVLSKWGSLTVFLISLGGAVGYSFRPSCQASCTTQIIQRDIPPKSWYMKTLGQMFLGGLVPFVAIFMQLDDMYATLWNRKVCGAFSTMFRAFLTVTSTTTMTGMAFTLYQFSKQDHQWWWRSVLRGGSTAIYMFAYGAYFHYRTKTEGFMKLLLFMGYNACIFYSFFLILGTIGFYASLLVFRCMYSSLQKQE